jgi:hypothetical protein
VADDRDAGGGWGHSEYRIERDAYIAGRDITIHYPPAEQPGAAVPAPTGDLRTYLEKLAESYRWLEYQGLIQEADSVRVELERVYVALRTEPATDYDLRHLADLHLIEVREAAGGTPFGLIEPTRLAELDAENVRRNYRPRREEERLAHTTAVHNIADAFQRHHRIVILGDPGSGKTTLGHWLALQLARGMLRQMPDQVPPEAEPDLTVTARRQVRAGATAALTARDFIPPDQADTITAIRIEALPGRGKLALSGRPVTDGQVIPVGQIDQLSYTPTGNECGPRYAHLRFAAGGRTPSHMDGAIVLDVATDVLVPLSQVDPDRPDEAESADLADLGPARVPVFLRLAHYAREIAERKRRDEPALSIEEYLGRDPDSCDRDDGYTPEDRNALLRASLGDGQTIVILDGLDELPEANRRDVLPQIHDFIAANTTQNTPDEAAAPGLAGGNQVVVTSRYVGYESFPVKCGCAHFGIQPMQRPAVEHFARSWSAAVNAQLGPTAPRRLSAEGLIAEIYEDVRPKVRELATYPLLISILAIVYWTDGRLPDQRAAVYDRVVENLLLIWLNRPECQKQFLVRGELLAALEPLAAHMHETSSGMISLERFKQLIEAPLARSRHTTPADASFRPVLDALLTTVRKHVGLLAEKSPDNYAFFHRTFQEFLAARFLLSDRQRAAGSIVERLDDPQWREPLLLALGLAMISDDWDEQPARERLLSGVLASDSDGTPIPRAAMLVISALPDLRNVPQRVLAQLVGQLLGSYALSQGQSHAEGLREAIRAGFSRLREGPQAEAAAEAIAEVIRQPAERQDRAGAAAEILMRIGWFTTGIVDALLRVAYRDQARLGWPVRSALLAALAQPAPELDTARLVAAHLPMRQLLESDPDLTAVVRGDVNWLWLLTALYGGLGHVQARGELQAYQLRRLRELTGASDKAAEPPPSVSPVEFSPGNIVLDLADHELSSAIARQLRAGEPADALAPTFREAWERGSAEALVGLAALGDDVVPVIRAALADRSRQPAARAVLSQFRWLSTLLGGPIARASGTAARTIPEEAPQERQLDLLRILIEGGAAAGAGPLLVSDTIPAYRYVAAASPAIRAELDAEYWAYLFSGLAGAVDDDLDAALMPGTEADPSRLIRGWSQLSRARNLLARPRLPWPQEDLSPRPRTPVERYLMMLDELLETPPEYSHHAGFLLGRCRALLAEHPALIWETLAVCWSKGGAFVRGYLAGATGVRVLRHASGAMAADLVSAWDRHPPDTEEAESLRSALDKYLRWRAMDGTELEPAAPESVLRLLAEADRIDDPYLRFRALWRTMWATRMVPAGLDFDGVIAEIADPHEQARALEWIITSVPDERLGVRVSEALVAELAELFSRIADPEDRALAQGRLAFLLPEQLGELLAAAVESVGQITDPRRRAEVIFDIRAALSERLGVAQTLDSAANALPEPWLRDKAHGRASRLIAVYRDRYGAGRLVWRLPPEATALGAGSCRRPDSAGPLVWGMLYLNAVANEVGALTAVPTGSEAGWELLLGPESQAGVNALIESAADGGLGVSAATASVLNRVIQAGHAVTLGPLWPYLDSPDAVAMATIARWTAGDVQLQRWKALVLMEAGRLTPDIVGPVVDLLASPADRLRLRAALALHGPYPYSNNPNRRWSVVRVGPEAIEALAGHAIRVDYPPSVRSALDWVQCNIRHDDERAFGRWLSAAAADEDTPAEWILASIESIDDDLVAPLLEALPSARPGLQRTLLNGLSQVANSRGIPAGAQDGLRAAIAAVPAAVRRKVRAVPQGPVTLLEAVATAMAEPDEDTRLAVARSIFEGSEHWLDDECLADSETCLNRLKEIGHWRYIQLGKAGYFQGASEAAAALAENEDALRLLLAWAESISRVERPPHNSDIMTALEAVARLSPSAFAALADPDIWEPILVGWVENSGSWVVRLAAVRLLGMLRRVTDCVATALRVAMQDNSHVQQAAYAAAGEFRSMEGDVIEKLLSLLTDPSAGVVASTARLLVSLARGEGSPDRRRILRGLQDAVTCAPLAASVYLMESGDGQGAETIRFVDRLDRILYQAIFEVDGS